MTKTIFAAAAIIALMTGKVNLTQTDITKYDGWTRPGETEVTPVTQSIFDQAMDGIIGVNYTPVEIIDTKTANGTDYMYRCESQVVYPGAEKKESIVTIHVDPEGHVSVLNIETA